MKLDNTFARELPELGVEHQPTAVPAPKLVAFNAHLATELGLDPKYLESTEGVAVLAGNATTRGATPIRRSPIRRLLPTAWRRTRPAPRRTLRRRRPPRRPPQGIWSHTIRPRGRRQGGTGLNAARVPHGRGTARSQDRHRQGASRSHYRGEDPPGRPRTRRRSDPCRGQPHPRWDIRIRSTPRRPHHSATARRPRHRPPLPGHSRTRRAPVFGTLGSRGRRASVADRRLDATA